MWNFARRVCVCVRERESHHSAASFVSVCVCEKEREGDTVTRQRLVCKHIRASSLCLSRNSVSLSAWTDGKTKDIINCLRYKFESWSLRLWKGALHVRRGLWCSADHNALCQLANQSRLGFSGGGSLCLREAGHRGPTIMYSIWNIICFLNNKTCQHILLHQIHKIMIFKKSIIWPL